MTVPATDFRVRATITTAKQTSTSGMANACSMPTTDAAIPMRDETTGILTYELLVAGA